MARWKCRRWTVGVPGDIALVHTAGHVKPLKGTVVVNEEEVGAGAYGSIQMMWEGNEMVGRIVVYLPRAIVLDEIAHSAIRDILRGLWLVQEL